MGTPPSGPLSPSGAAASRGRGTSLDPPTLQARSWLRAQGLSADELEQVRGGGWNTLASEAEELATQYRKAIAPDTADIFYGFRVMVALTPAAMSAAAATATPPPAASTSPLPSAFPDPTIFDESTSD